MERKERKGKERNEKKKKEKGGGEGKREIFRRGFIGGNPVREQFSKPSRAQTI